MRKFVRRGSDEYDRYEEDNFRNEANNFDQLYDADEYSLRREREYPPVGAERGEYGRAGERGNYSRRLRSDEAEEDDSYGRRMRRYAPPDSIGARGGDSLREEPRQQPEREEKIGANNVVVSYPRTYSDVQRLIDSLRNKQAVIVDIAKIDQRDAQRILDFLSGAIYALGGSQQRIASSIYLLTPGGISIKIPYELKEKLERGKK